MYNLWCNAGKPATCILRQFINHLRLYTNFSMKFWTSRSPWKDFEVWNWHTFTSNCSTTIARAFLLAVYLGSRTVTWMCGYWGFSIQLSHSKTLWQHGNRVLKYAAACFFFLAMCCMLMLQIPRSAYLFPKCLLSSSTHPAVWNPVQSVRFSVQINRSTLQLILISR